MQDDRPDDGQNPGPKTRWAEERTDWAEDRTLQANERTFAGWVRTGLGAVAVAIGLKAVFGSFEPTWAAKAVATGFLLVAIFLFVSAARKAAATQARLSRHESAPPDRKSFYLIAGALSAGSVGAGVILWLL